MTSPYLIRNRLNYLSSNRLNDPYYTSGSEKSDTYGSLSSYGGGSCCEGVIDPLTFISLLAFLGLATYFLNELIAMSNLMMARRRKRDTVPDIFKEGKII